MRLARSLWRMPVAWAGLGPATAQAVTWSPASGSDTLEAESWSTVGIAIQNPTPIAQDNTSETMRILVPAGSGRRFVRLKMTRP